MNQKSNLPQSLIYLYLYLGENFQGPGWYIRTITDQPDGPDPVLISTDVASALGRAFDEAIRVSVEESPAEMPLTLVENGHRLLYATLQEQLADAEAKAARIAILRQRLGALNIDPDERNNDGEHQE